MRTPLDLTGQKFGRLTALEPLHVGKVRSWRCQCDCGNAVTLPTFALSSGGTKSCGCLLAEQYDLTGRRYGALTVLSLADDRDDKGRRQYACRCDCGNDVEVASRNLFAGKTTHCGCMASENRSRGRWAATPPQQAIINAVFHDYKGNAKRKSLEFDLTVDDVERLIFDDCYYCGAPPQRERKTARATAYVNGIDRFDNSRGYVSDNCVPCCFHCNMAKRGLSGEAYIHHARAIAARWRSL